MYKSMAILILILIVLMSCAVPRTYQLGSQFNNLQIEVSGLRSINDEFQGYVRKGFRIVPPAKSEITVSGFYIPQEHKIYTIKDFDILLHELWHASGYLGEPEWKK